MKTYSITDTGALREMNQDYFFASDDPVGNLPNLYIVADGMGGHKAGDYASRYTTQRVVASVSRDPGEKPVSIIKKAISTANKILIEEAAEDESKQGMGTTLVVATIIDGKLYPALDSDRIPLHHPRYRHPLLQVLPYMPYMPEPVLSESVRSAPPQLSGL